jgi:hypothetical protein
MDLPRVQGRVPKLPIPGFTQWEIGWTKFQEAILPNYIFWVFMYGLESDFTNHKTS